MPALNHPAASTRVGDMTKRIRIITVTAGLTFGLLGTAACAHEATLSGTRSGRVVTIQVAATRTQSTPQPAQTPDDLQAAGLGNAPQDVPTTQKPVPEPTVAKTQKWVKIMSGPSKTDIKPPADKAKGSHTVELNATPNAQIGTYLTDGAGRTLYVFDKDSSNPPKSNCNGSCATAWPPLLIKSPGKIYPKGVNPKILGYVERADGHCQVTVNGHPVYFFVADAKAGDINGQGVNGTWFAVRPDGGKTTATPVFPSPTK
jgi:predicted lipoprotein with Yx(FWY)xxD motif